MTKKRLFIALAAFLMALILCAGLALAAALTRTIHMDWYEPLAINVSPELAVSLSAPYGQSSSQTYTVTNPTPASYTVTCSTDALPVEVTVTFTPNNVFTLAAGASQNVLVTVANTGGTPPDSDIILHFDPSA